MPPCRSWCGGFSCFEPCVDVHVGEDHQAGIAGLHLKRNWHENRDVAQDGIREGTEFHRRLNAGSPGFRIKADDVTGQGAMQGMEDFLLQCFALFVRKCVVHTVSLSVGLWGEGASGAFVGLQAPVGPALVPVLFGPFFFFNLDITRSVISSNQNKSQYRNRRTNVYITVDGETHFTM